LTCFKARNSLKQFKHHGEGASADPEVVQTERGCIQELIETHGYKLKDIFNMDETGLFYEHAPFILFTPMTLMSVIGCPHADK
jgi:hypothetical protein